MNLFPVPFPHLSLAEASRVPLKVCETLFAENSKPEHVLRKRPKKAAKLKLVLCKRAIYLIGLGHRTMGAVTRGHGYFPPASSWCGTAPGRRVREWDGLLMAWDGLPSVLHGRIEGGAGDISSQIGEWRPVFL